MTSSKIKSIDAANAAEWLRNDDAILIDVREAHEFQHAHIPNAASVPLSLLTTQFDVSLVPAGKKIIFQCLKGARGQQACEIMRDKTTRNEIYNLEGGIEAWEGAQLPIIKAVTGSKTTIAIFRQIQIAIGGLILALILLGYSGVSGAFAIAALISAMLAIAGITGWCGMALLLAKMPWNRAT